ncbi:MAG: MFS transporter, partial [Alphaproteobacteria bacterium]
MSHICRPPCDDAVIRSVPDVPPCARLLGRWVLAATIIGSSMAFIDGTVVNVALPVLQADFHATAPELLWIVESYLLFLGALILVGGMLGDHFGHRRIYAGGVALFAAASAWCGLAPDSSQLIIARAVQGVGGALLVPGSLAIISATFGEGQRARAIGTWSGFTALTMALGPVLGGWLVDNVSWRWIFFINVPPAAIVIWILYRRVPESREETEAAALDWPGALLATVGLGAIVFGLIEAGIAGFEQASALGPLAVGAVVMIAFLLVEARVRAPMVPLGLFRSRAFSGANFVTLLLYAALSGGLFYFPFNLIQVQGYSATAAGAAFLPFVLIMFVLSRWSGGLVDRYGGRLPLVIGPTVAAAGYALFAVPSVGGGYWTTFFPAVAVLGVGMAISVAPLTTVVLAAVDVRRAGVASGINNAVARIAGLLAIAVMGVFVLGAFNGALDGRLATLELPAGARQMLDQERIKLAGAEIPGGLGAQLQAALEQAVADAFVSGFRLAMLIAAGLALASALVALLTVGRGS